MHPARGQPPSPDNRALSHGHQNPALPLPPPYPYDPPRTSAAPAPKAAWRLLAGAWLVGLTVALAALLPQALGWASLEQPGSRVGDGAGGMTYPCLSYAPFRRPGHTPMDPALELTREQIAEDLRLLQPLTRCVRLYGVGHGQYRVPEVAARLGLSVVLGAWVSRDLRASQQEIDTALALAHEYPSTVRMLVVGNEVLLRQEQAVQALAVMLRDARARSPVPVAYADVWEFWLRHRSILAPAVDVVAVHILPYWEDEPVGIDRAVGHVLSIHQQVQQVFAPKRVWLAETGWPAAGRQRGPAQPGPREQAMFGRELRVRLGEAGIDYNLIEAFDQPWKRALEGAMGGAWGVIDAKGQLKDDPHRAFPADPGAAGAWLGAVLGATLVAVGALCARSVRLSRHSPPGSLGHQPADAPPAGGGVRSLLWASAVITTALLLGHHLATVSIWLRTPAEWAQALLAWSAAAGVSAHALFRVWCHTCGEGLVDPAFTPHTAAAAQRPFGLVRAAGPGLLFLLAWEALTLVFDGRYRALPASLVAAPALSLWMAGLLTSLSLRATGAERFMALVLIVAGPALIFMEGTENGQAWALAGAWMALGAWWWLIPLHRQNGADRSTPADFNASKAKTKTAAAERSVS